MAYALQASCTLALLYAVYWLLFRRTSFHHLNRIVLLSIALASLLLPLAARLIPNLAPAGHIIADGYLKYTAPLPLSVPITIHSKPIPQITPTLLITVAYLIGLAICLIRTIAPILTLAKLIRQIPTHREADYTLVELKQPSPPFSFFRWIFLYPDNYTPTQQRNILLHEQVHIKQLHTLDILFMESFAALFWFHPHAWRLNAATKLNLEYLADRELLDTGVEQKEYQYHLLELTVGPSLTRMANYFNQSHLKKRIAMMNNTTRRTAIWKYLFFLPVLTALCLAFASLKAQSPANGKTTDIFIVIRPETTEALLRKIESNMTGQGVNISFSNISFTSQHELSGLRIAVIQDGRTLEDISVDGRGKPLAEPIVFYWLRSRQANPIITRWVPANMDKKDLKIVQNLNGLLETTPGTQEFELHGAARIGD